MENDARSLRPKARKPFELTPSTGSSRPTTPPTGDDSSSADDAGKTEQDGELSSADRSRSVFDLTSPALLGIFSPTALEGPVSPWGTGAQTPTTRGNGAISQDGELELAAEKAAIELRNRAGQRRHVPRKHGFRGVVLPLIRRSLLLFLFGMTYGLIITHLHDDLRVSPFTADGTVDLSAWKYMAFWGMAGVALGNLLPWFDGIWENTLGDGAGSREEPPTIYRQTSFGRRARPSWLANAEWSPMVRGIGAFVGIAFAIRRLPWQSTLQVSLSLSLANPFLWYLLDRTKPGFVFSAIVGVIGMLAILNIDPDIIPTPAALSTSDNGTSGFSGDITPLGVSLEGIAAGTWIASVLFCSCVCFGSIGRRLAS